jgi:2'-5' RNA ligase
VRLLVAAWPPAEVVDALASLRRPEVSGLRWTTAGQWHVTLRFLGEVERAEPSIAAVATAAQGLEPVRAQVGPVVARLGRGVVMAPVHGLDTVAETVIRATAAFGEAPEDRPFRGHVTLARCRRGPRPPAEALGAPIEGEWLVRELSIVRSHLGGGAAHYERLASLPLGSSPR